jgi:hypothetical protein
MLVVELNLFWGVGVGGRGSEVEVGDARAGALFAGAGPSFMGLFILFFGSPLVSVGNTNID